MGSLFGQQSCLGCQSEVHTTRSALHAAFPILTGSCASLLAYIQLINAETNKKQDEWSNVRPVLEELKDQIRAILLRSGTHSQLSPFLLSLVLF